MHACYYVTRDPRSGRSWRISRETRSLIMVADARRATVIACELAAAEWEQYQRVTVVMVQAEDGSWGGRHCFGRDACDRVEAAVAAGAVAGAQSRSSRVHTAPASTRTGNTVVGR